MAPFHPVAEVPHLETATRRPAEPWDACHEQSWDTAGGARLASSAITTSRPRALPTSARGTRGRLDQGHHPRPLARNSPACAGTTTCRIPAASRAREQPRVRGDDHGGHRPVGGADGTAPRARGRPASAARSIEPDRNSPACAGTTPLPWSPPPGRREQPRVRGDDRQVLRGEPAAVGTAPRARGRPARTCGSTPDGGNSPACAGTTPFADRAGCRSAEQPRVRGDDGVCRELESRVQGTAPRARGRLQGGSGAVARRRNSPACAGTTLLDLRRYERHDRFSFTFLTVSRIAQILPAHSMPCPRHAVHLARCRSIGLVAARLPGPAVVSARPREPASKELSAFRVFHQVRPHLVEHPRQRLPRPGAPTPRTAS